MSELINLSYHLLLLITIIVGTKQGAFSKPFVFPYILCIVALIAQVVAMIYISNERIQFYAFNTYQIIEIIGLSAFYMAILRGKMFRTLIITYCLGFCLWYILYYLNNTDGLGEVSFVGFMLEAPLIILCSLLWFYNIVKNPVDMPLLKHPIFWFNVGHLIYFAIPLFVMGLYSTLVNKDSNTADITLNIQRTVNFIFYLMYIVGFIYSNNKRWT